MSVSNFLQDLELASTACRTNKNTEMWRFKQSLTHPAKGAVKALVTLSNSASFYYEGAVKLFSINVRLILQRYFTDESIAKLDEGVRILR